MGFFDFFKKGFKKADDLREKVEDDIAGVLEKASACSVLDDGEKMLLKAGIKAGVSYASQGAYSLSDAQLESISTAIVNGQNKFDLILAKQLRKK